MMIMRDGRVLHDDIWEMPNSKIADAIFGVEKSAKDYKPIHGGYPDYPPAKFLERDSSLSFKQAVTKPSIYFDGVLLEKTLSVIAHDASNRLWRLQTALRNLRNADTAVEMANARDTLQATYNNILQEEPNAKVALLVDQLADQIDIMAPANPIGYVPHMGLHYAAKPLRKIIETIKGVFNHDGA